MDTNFCKSICTFKHFVNQATVIDRTCTSMKDTRAYRYLHALTNRPSGATSL